MDELVLVESRRHLVSLTHHQAARLQALGKQLASSKQYWGTADNPDDGSAQEAADRTVIRCLQAYDGKYEVTINEAVGIVALPDLQVVVEPKIPLEHFRYLLVRSPAFPRLGEDDAAAASSTELWDLVASWFLTSLEALLRRGLLSDYEEMSGALPAVRGSIRLTDTATGYYRGSTLIACDYDEFGPDTALNRILRAAALAVAHATVLDADLRRRARRAAARLEDVGALRSADLRTVLDRRTTGYDAPVSLARHVLAATGRTISGGAHHARTFLIRTPDLVEESLRRILREGTADLVPLKKKGVQLLGSKLTLNPDLVFGDLATGDVKYKVLGNDWKRADLYQAVTFATGFGVDQSVIVTFTRGAPDPPPLQVGQVTVRVLTWDCSPHSTPDASAQVLVGKARRWLESVLQPSSSPGLTR